jgi:putative FmdB family regulatory protein
MPWYEFRCHDCGKLLRFYYSFSEYDSAEPVCTRCQSRNVRRRIRRVALAKSEESRMDNMLDESSLAGLENEDPRELGRFMRRMSTEMGEDMGEEFGEVIDRLEKGQSPEDIEAALPDLGGGGDDDFGLQ